MKNLFRVLLVGLVAGLFGVVSTSPAFAHYDEVWQGNDWGYNGPGHTSGGNDDNECDGHDIYQKVYTLYDGGKSGDTHTFWNSGCNDGVRTWGLSGEVIIGWRLCEDLQGNHTSATADDRCVYEDFGEV